VHATGDGLRLSASIFTCREGLSYTYRDPVVFKFMQESKSVTHVHKVYDVHARLLAEYMQGFGSHAGDVHTGCSSERMLKGVKGGMVHSCI